jgi:hypothetical protein
MDDTKTQEDGSYLSAVLAAPPPLQSFDAFKKTNSTYRERTARGGFFTVVIALVLGALIWTELREYLWGEPDYSFSVDKGIAHDLQVNFDATVATPCHCTSFSSARCVCVARKS